MDDFNFTLLHKSSPGKPRLGEIRTAHGVIKTPAFMPVGTAGTVKALTPRQLEEVNSQIILGNTYHLYLRPGTPLIAQAGGLHHFMSWHRPILTDSGGFQVWSLKSIRKISEDGVEFQSHIDGSRHLFTPESVMKAQRDIGADIIMAFDECTPYPATEKEALHSLNLTLKWTERAVEYLAKNLPIHGYDQAFFGIVQGGMYKKYRAQAIEHLAKLDLPGYALGGLSVGEPADMLYDIADHCSILMPEDKPRYIMGVGTPDNLVELVARGYDMFDCVMPTRNARNGMIFTYNGKLSYKAARFAQDFNRPWDENCTCYTCRNFSRGYLRHLFNSKELLIYQLASIHNLHFYNDLMATMRDQIEKGTFETWKQAIIPRLQARVED